MEKHYLNYCITLPISGDTVTFRPYSVGEEKVIMLTKGTENKKEIFLCIKKILEKCFNIDDVSEYELADIDYMLLNLRAKSAGETEPFKIKCPYTEDTCHFTVSLSTPIVNKNKPNTKIKIKSNFYINLEYPKLKHIIKTPDYDTNIKNVLNFITSCIKDIQIKNKKITKEEEKLNIINKLKPNEFKQIINFFDLSSSLFIIGKYLTKNKEIKEVKIKGTYNIFSFFFDYITLFSFYRLAFQMKYYHHFSIQEIENLIPWERQIYIEQIKKHLEKEENNQ